MMSSPLSSSETFSQLPLSDDMSQRIHAFALFWAARGYTPSGTPEHILVEQLQQQISRNGPESCFRHPCEVAALFTGMTVGIYRTIETLYCSHIGRNIRQVWRILTAMTQASGSAPISYEAVWAICLFLKQHREASVSVSIEHGQEHWWLGTITMDQPLQKGTERASFSVLCVIDLYHSRVLSFSIPVQEVQEQQASLILYDALLSLRRPQQRALTGILWHLPKRITTEIALPPAVLSAWRTLGIPIDDARVEHPLLQELQDAWANVLTNRALSSDHLMAVLDRTLEKNFGYGPMRLQTLHEQEYRHLVGYTQEPDVIFPLLRSFLAEHSVTVSHEGSIEYDQLHYTDLLLSYALDHVVTIRRPPQTEAHVWVYEGNEILCQAMACELRRHDGTYRRSRPGR